jgi:hypothetical protein
MYTQDTRRLLTRAVDGTYPIDVYPVDVATGSGEVSLIFRVQTMSKEASILLLRSCKMGFTSVLITFADGSEAEVRAPGYVVGLHPDTARCSALDSAA